MLTLTEIKDSTAWDEALLALPNPHILQSWAWGETKAQTGWRARRLLWEDAGRPVAAASLLVRRLQVSRIRLPLAVAYVPKGPLLDWSNGALRQAVLADLENTTKQTGALLLKVDPGVSPDDPTGEATTADLVRRGWRASHPSRSSSATRSSTTWPPAKRRCWPA